MNITKFFSLLLFIFGLGGSSLFAQLEMISFDSLKLENTILLFESYEEIGKNCENKNGLPAFCAKEERLFDNNMSDLVFMREQALTYLNFQYEVVSDKELDKAIYKDKEAYRYFFKYKAEVSKKVGSCMSNPGALLIRYFVFDRLTEQTYELDIKYNLFTCDIDLLVNEINEAIKVKKEKE